MRFPVLSAVLAAAVLAQDAASARTLWRGHRLNVQCNGVYMRQCGGEGCAPLDGNEIAVPVSMRLDVAHDRGELCMATGCHDVRLAALPEARDTPVDPVFRAVTSQSEAGLVSLEGVVSLSPGGEAFQLIQSGTTIWGGACEPAAP